MIANLSNPSMWMSLLILTALEVVLGIDNIIFLAIASARLPRAQQNDMAPATSLPRLLSNGLW